MVPASRSRVPILVALVVIAVVFAGITHASVNDLPGFSDHTGPAELSVDTFERVGASCVDAVGSGTGTSISDGYARAGFVETGDPNASLSAWVERTSPPGADLSTFRVHVDSHGSGNASNASCTVGVRYRIELTPHGGSPAGFIPDAYGTRVLWLVNGRYDGCSASVTSPLDAECDRLRRTPAVVWANASD